MQVRKKINKSTRILSILFIIVFISACVLLVFVEEGNLHGVSANGAIAAIISASISVLLTASVTSELIKSQSDSEEIKEQNIRVFEKKITIYQEFLEKLHKIVSKGKISEDDVNELLFQISYVSMHAKPDHVKQVFLKLQESISLITGDIDDQERKKRAYIRQLESLKDNNPSNVTDGYYNRLATSIFAVVKELRNDLYGTDECLDVLGFDELMQKIDDSEERKGNIMLIGADESKKLIERLCDKLKRKVEMELKPEDGWNIFYTKATNWDFRIQHNEWKESKSAVGLFTEGIAESEQFFFVIFNSDDFRNYYSLMRDMWGGKFSSKQWMLIIKEEYSNWKYSPDRLAHYLNESEEMLNYMAIELVRYAKYIRTLHTVYNIKQIIHERAKPSCYEWIFQNHCLVYEYLDEDICIDIDQIDEGWRVMLYCRSGNTIPLSDIIPEIPFDGYRKVYYHGNLDDKSTAIEKTIELIGKVEQYIRRLIQ